MLKKGLLHWCTLLYKVGKTGSWYMHFSRVSLPQHHLICHPACSQFRERLSLPLKLSIFALDLYLRTMTFSFDFVTVQWRRQSKCYHPFLWLGKWALEAAGWLAYSHVTGWRWPCTHLHRRQTHTYEPPPCWGSIYSIPFLRKLRLG